MPYQALNPSEYDSRPPWLTVINIKLEGTREYMEEGGVEKVAKEKEGGRTNFIIQQFPGVLSPIMFLSRNTINTYLGYYWKCFICVNSFALFNHRPMKCI